MPASKCVRGVATHSVGPVVFVKLLNAHIFQRQKKQRIQHFICFAVMIGTDYT